MNCEEKAAINSIEELPKIALKIGPKLKDIRDSLSDALGDYEMMIRKFRGSMVKNRCKKQAKTGPCTHCIFLKKDKGCVLAAYFPNGWEEQMEEE